VSLSRRINAPGLATFAVLILLWEVSTRLDPVMGAYLPPVSRILQSLFQLALSRELFAHLTVTLGRFLAGYILAAVIAVALGIILGYFRRAYNLCEIVIELLRPMPSVAIIPVAILMLGIGNATIVAVTVYASAWPILINTIDGVRNIDRTLLDTGRTFGLGRWRILRAIALPAALPYIVTGLRVSLSVALILVTTGEMVVGSSGLGFFILDEERSLRTSNMYAGIALVSLLGYALNRLFVWLDATAMKWHRGMTARETL
jgi:NitT/TauT family transport system permease protein